MHFSSTLITKLWKHLNISGNIFYLKPSKQIQKSRYLGCKQKHNQKSALMPNLSLSLTHTHTYTPVYIAAPAVSEMLGYLAPELQWLLSNSAGDSLPPPAPTLLPHHRHHCRLARHRPWSRWHRLQSQLLLRLCRGETLRCQRWRSSCRKRRATWGGQSAWCQPDPGVPGLGIGDRIHSCQPETVCFIYHAFCLLFFFSFFFSSWWLSQVTCYKPVSRHMAILPYPHFTSINQHGILCSNEVTYLFIWSTENSAF